MRNFHFPGRSPVIGTKAMCATSHPLASVAAIDMLKQGGNAVDAAITATAVMCVVEPAMTGIGGDCFALIAKPGQKPIALNGSGRAPKAATVEWYQKAGIKQIETQTPHAVSIPCSIDAWATLLKDHGRKTFADVLAPAIEYAEKGFPVHARVAHDWATLETKIKGNVGATKHLLKDGRIPRVGEIMKFPALGKTLRRIAEQGRDGFYTGEVAADMVAELKGLGGLHTLEDFAGQRCSYVDPISVDYKGTTLYELPPNLHGIVALVMLKILDRIGGKLGDGPASTERYHVLMEAVRLTFAMRDQFVADPERADVPVAHMLSDAFADELAKRIDRKVRKADLGPIPEPKGTDTIYMTVVDGDGMAVSFINSIFSGFGSGLATQKTGVVFHNRAQGFVLDPKHRNCIAPGKRPMHTLVPAMAYRDGKPWLSFGVMGANFQPMGHVYVMSNMLDYGMDPQEALDNPRVFFEGGKLWVEDSVPADVANALKAMGHPVERRPEPWGGGQIVMFDRANGTLVGASDPRKDGMALGY
ncbi:MAG: gamma-glutamyltransferase [Hyphomicrobiaceae bacterium]